MNAKSANTTLKQVDCSLPAASGKIKDVLRFKHRMVEQGSPNLDAEKQGLAHTSVGFDRAVTSLKVGKKKLLPPNDTLASHAKILRKKESKEESKPYVHSKTINLPGLPSSKKSSKADIDEAIKSNYKQSKILSMNLSMEIRKTEAMIPMTNNKKGTTSGSQSKAGFALICARQDFSSFSAKGEEEVLSFPNTSFGDDLSPKRYNKDLIGGQKANWKTNHYERMHKKAVIERKSRGFFIMQSEGQKYIHKNGVSPAIQRHSKQRDYNFEPLLEVKDCFMPTPTVFSSKMTE